MEHEVSWEYWTDHEQNIKTTKFYLYRNPIYLGPDGQKRGQFCTDFEDPENPKNHISSSKPIAFGISVFFAMGLPKLRDLSDILYLEEGLSSANLYQLYFNIVSKSALNSIRQDRISNTEERFLLEFQTRHLKEEKQYLIESEKYYSEFINEEDHNLKMVIKKHVNNYINWLSAKNKALLRQVAYIESPSKLNLINPKTAIKPKQPQSLSSLSPIEYIVLTEKILKYFNVCFREQAFPDFKPTIITFLKSIQPKDYEYVYYIHNDPLLFEPARFEILIKGLDMKKKRLQDILRVCFEFSKANSEIYFNLLANKRFDGYYTRYIEFEPMTTYTSEYLDPPNDKAFNDFSNHKIGNYCNHIYSYLLYEVYDGSYKEAGLNSARNKQSENKKTIIPIVRSQLDRYIHFEYIQVVENLLNFIRQKFEFQVGDLNCMDYIFNDTKPNKVEYKYEIEIDSDMLESNYFKRRCKELYASKEFDQNKLSHVLENTYQLAKTIYEYYIANISKVEFDTVEIISLSYDQPQGVITDIIPPSKGKLYSNQDLAIFCNNVSVIIQSIFRLDATSFSSDKDTIPIEDRSSFKSGNPSKSTSATTSNLELSQKEDISNQSFDTSIIEELNQILFQLYPENYKNRIIDLNFKIYLTHLFLYYIDPEVNEKPTLNGQYIIYDNKSFYSIISKVLFKYCINSNRIKKDISDALRNVSEKTVGNRLPSWKHIKAIYREKNDKNRENRENREK